MIKAGALTYSIFVMVIAGVLCLLMISLAYMNRSYFIHVDVHDVVRDNAHSGIELGKAIQSDEDHDQWYDLFDEGRDSVKLKRRLWGCYRVISSLAKTRGEIYAKTLVMGYEVPDFNTTALWLTDRNRPLQLTGDALLKGHCALPQKGVDRAYIEGTNFKRERLVYGSTSNSQERMPEPEKAMQPYWMEYLKGSFQPTDSVIDFSQLPPILNHSFFKKTIVARSNEPINLDQYKLKGNIIIYSNFSISASSGSQLENIMLVAPKLTLGLATEGIVHALASDSVIVGEEVTLRYPSSILLMARGTRLPHCRISKKARVNGVIACFADGIARSNKLMLEIAEEAVIRGLVYCEDNFEHAGLVEGTVIANRFLLATPSGIYENHILNGQINRSALPKTFGGIRFKEKENFTKNLAWLNY